MAQQDRYGVKRKKPKSNAVIAFSILLLVFVTAGISLGLFFRVKVIEVEGAVTYTPEQIIEAAGVDVDDNLFFINRGHAASRIYSRLAQVEGADLETVLPNKLVIHVKESSALAYTYAADGETTWVFTSNGKLLESRTPDAVQGLLQVVNVTPVEPEAGKPMKVEVGEELKLTYLQELLGAMEELNMTQDVSWLDLSNAADPTFLYAGRFTVRMGPNNNTSYKLRMLLSAVTQLDSSEVGTFDLSDGMTVRFTPE